MVAGFTDKKIKQNQNTGFRIINDQAILIDPQKGKIHRLNPTATRIWQLAEESCSLKDIISQIHSEFEVTQETARKDTEDFVNIMLDEGLMVIED